MKYKQVSVEWWDACSKSEWVTKADLPELVQVKTTGWKIRETKTSITICGSKHDDNTFGDCITIPKPWIH